MFLLKPRTRRLPHPAGLHHRAGAALLVAAAATIVLTFAVRASGHRPTAARAAGAPLTVTTRLPEWRAPGVPVSVSGFAAASERVALRVDGRVVDIARAGRRGRYHLRYPRAALGRHRLTVVAAGRSRRVGILVVRPVVIEAVGDITFGEQVGPTIAAYGPRYPWLKIARTLRAADITIGNLETAVSTRGVAAAKKYTFRGTPAALRPLHSLAGFDVLTLANNHTVDYGRDALEDTVRSVRAAGIHTIGAGRNAFAARRPAIVERGGLRVAFLGYSDVNPLGFTATADEPGTAAADVAEITADVRDALRHADVAACFFHWGTELHPDPDGRQVLFATACLRGGATIVLGAHPHVLGPVETPSRRFLVAWTLGNFVFPSSGVTARSGILRIDVGARGVTSHRLIPVTIEGFRPRLGASG